ncbi:hypothetical protein KOI40_01190 [Aestuariicella sp. G3-2]|uniref:DUF6316 family protein n=1 Tax=Pseudomaricurvus albidus TaxID=2842452 RepID=UPI001C0ABB29|nr:DUF6316 family protein [Aestuariicella albida]MBU3068409.1 hypothetical protein [Aestuariicella albida]
MKALRQGETGRPPERNDRFFKKDEYWYYTTREGVDIGPFDSEDDAITGCSDFIEFIFTSDPDFPSTLEQYGRHVA